MILGFTGTRHALTPMQDAMLEVVVATIDRDTPIMEAHHGDCVGADARFDHWCAVLGIERHSHPGPLDRHRAHCDAECVYEPMPYLDRNRWIVDRIDVLVACPEGPERQRSGTWSTVRYARRTDTPVITVWPDGRVDW